MGGEGHEGHPVDNLTVEEIEYVLSIISPDKQEMIHVQSFADELMQSVRALARGQRSQSAEPLHSQGSIRGSCGAGWRNFSDQEVCATPRSQPLHPRPTTARAALCEAPAIFNCPG